MAPQRRGIVPEPHASRLREMRGRVDQAYADRDQAVADALKAGGSAREVAELVGLSPATVIAIGHRHGWPTVEQKQERDERHDQIAGWNAAIRTGMAMLGAVEPDEADPPAEQQE